jgi:hypothetical protein
MPESSSSKAGVCHVLCGANVKNFLAFWHLTGCTVTSAEGPVDVFPSGCERSLVKSNQERTQVTAMADAGPGKLAVAFGDGTLRLIHLPTLATIAQIDEAHSPPAHAILILYLRGDAGYLRRAAAGCIHVLPPPTASTACVDSNGGTADMISADSSGRIHQWRFAGGNVAVSLAGESRLQLDDSADPGARFSAGCPLALWARAERSDAATAPSGAGGSAQPKRHELWDVVGGRAVARLEAPPPTMAAPPRLSVRARRRDSSMRSSH